VVFASLCRADGERGMLEERGDQGAAVAINMVLSNSTVQFALMRSAASAAVYTPLTVSFGDGLGKRSEGFATVSCPLRWSSQAGLHG
jgi:hypothetical protein